MKNPEKHTPLERQRLKRLAKEYQSDGYQVSMYPSADELPPSLANCPPDMVVSDGHQRMAIVVRSRETVTLNGPDDLRQMTHLVEQEPGWELQFVMTNPRKKAE